MHSILFKLGPITIYSYGFMLMLAFLAGTLVATRVARRRGIAPDVVLDLVAYLLIAALIGSRALYVALHWHYFRDHLGEIGKIWTGGLSYHGGLLGGILAGAWFCWRKRLSFLAVADTLMPSLALGYAVGRVGCFLNGCCYGAPTTLPWAFRFHDPPVTGPLTAPSHPTQIYASLINLAIFALLWWMAMRKTRPGQVFFVYLGLYSIYRFGIEFLRKGYTAQVWLGGLTQAQIGSLALIAVAVALYAWVSRPAPAAVETREIAGARPSGVETRN
jgi:phosphatidylglycerol:prolipoprotein diacylglycerol transferase